MEKLFLIRGQPYFTNPVVLLLVGGGLDALLHCLYSARNHMPILVCIKTGGAANILALACDLKKSGNFKNSELKQMIHKLCEIEKVLLEPEENIEDLLEEILLSTHIELIDLNKHSQLEQSLLQFSRPKSPPTSTLRGDNLVICYDDEIDEISQCNNESKFYKSFLKALIGNNTALVDHYLQHGVSLSSFLTLSRLRQLYNDGITTQPIGKYYKLERPIYLSDILNILKNMLPGFHNEFYDQDQDHATDMPSCDQISSDPFTDLFFWSIFLLRNEMAAYMWRRCNNSIHLALMANCILNTMLKDIPDCEIDNKTKLAKMKCTYANWCVGVLEECSQIDLDKAILLIENPQNQWSNVSSLELAAQQGIVPFVASPACHRSVWQRWRIHRIYSSQMRFLSHSISYAIFVLYLSLIVLFDIEPNFISFGEAIVYFYFMALITSEIHEIFIVKRKNFIDKILYWWKMNYWNHLDVLIILVAVAIVLIRLGFSFTFFFAKNLYAILIILVWFRLLRFYLAISYLGPKVIIFLKMINELLLFLLLLIIPIAALGVLTQSLLYPYATFSFQVLADIFFYAYFPIYNLVGLDYYNAILPGCGPQCPQYNFLVPLTFAIFLIVTATLLLSFLIAIFNSVYSKVQAEAILIWKFYFYFLLVEYEWRQIIPLPFSFFEDLIFFCSPANIFCYSYNDHSKQQENCNSALSDESLMEFEMFGLREFSKRPAPVPWAQGKGAPVLKSLE